VLIIISIITTIFLVFTGLASGGGLGIIIDIIIIWYLLKRDIKGMFI
jgi:hypothetical protein